MSQAELNFANYFVCDTKRMRLQCGGNRIRVEFMLVIYLLNSFVRSMQREITSPDT